MRDHERQQPTGNPFDPPQCHYIGPGARNCVRSQDMADIAVARAPFTTQSNRPLQRERGEIDTNWRFIVSELHLEQLTSDTRIDIDAFILNGRHCHTRQKVACPTHNRAGTVNFGRAGPVVK
jgi:hypothetical protein